MPRFLRWSALRLRTKGLIVVALPVLPLICFWLVVLVAYLREGTPANTTERNLTVQADLARVFSTLLDADSAARDNLLTDNKAAAERYSSAMARLAAPRNELNVSIIDPDLRVSLDDLNGVVDDEVAVLARVMGEPSPIDPTTIGERAALNRSSADLDRIRNVAGAIERGQASLAAVVADARQAERHRLFIMLLVGSVVCVGGGIILSLVKANDLRWRISILRQNAGRLARGEPIVPSPDGEDEIAELDAHFREAARLLTLREKQLHARTIELEAANHELESFNYSVSHDLRAPLRAIEGFSRAIDEQAHDRLDERGRHLLRRVRTSARRMGTLVDELLNLSHLSRLEVRREPLDLSATAKHILADLAHEAPAREVDVRIEPDLHIDADPQLVQIALQNLLDNAWKYTGKTPRPRIEIGSTANGRARVFHVRDNGAGFDMRHAKRLFAAFQRLHSPQDFDGTGVGLATVRRIVHRHGGKIWAEGAINAGATFYFTLEPEDARAIAPE
jgi:signal transduction histidine kinase